jgi:hypothetical protein
MGNNFSEQIIKVAFSGMSEINNTNANNILILRVIEAMSKSTVRIVADYTDADMIIAYPYGSGSILFKLKWMIFYLLRKITKIKDCTCGLRWILGIGSKPTLFISHENLDRPYWWRIYGELIVQSKFPRLTYWPKSIDSMGARFPYWYNYVEWPDYPRPNFYARFGKLYNLEVLMGPLKEDLARKDEVILVASHLDFPRESILQKLGTIKSIKIFGRAGSSFNGGKYCLMADYKYAFCSENSVGYGYDSEKIPEAWIAGCVPCGAYLNPFSDFNPKVINNIDCNFNRAAYSSPLLINKPSLNEIEEYVRNFLEENDLGNAHLPRGESLS